MSSAKLNGPAAPAVRRRLTNLENAFEPRRCEVARRGMLEFFKYAYNAETLRRILYLRTHLQWQRSDKADVVIRIGGKKFDTEEMGRQLTATSVFSARKTTLVYSEASEIKRKQPVSFRPGSKGCLLEADFHFRLN